LAVNVGNPSSRSSSSKTAARRSSASAPGVTHQTQRGRRESARVAGPPNPPGLEIREASRRPEEKADGEQMARDTPDRARSPRERWSKAWRPSPPPLPKSDDRALSDFKSTEYTKLLGGERTSPRGKNPMLGPAPAASRDISPAFRECFESSCAAARSPTTSSASPTSS